MRQDDSGLPGGFSTVVHPQPVDHVDNGFRDPPRKSLSPGANYKVVVLHIRPMGL